MSGSGWAEDVILMPVKLQWAQAVADLVRDLESGRSIPDAGGVLEWIDVPGQGKWDQGMIGSLAEATSYPAVLSILDRCASNAGRWTPKTETETELGITPVQLRNELVAFSKLTKSLFGRVRPIWPIQWGPRKGVRSGRMDPVIAEWWIAARRRAS